MWNFLAWIVIGGLAGWVASIITGRNDRMGCLTNIVAGVVGGIVGGWIVGAFGAEGVTGFNLQSFIVALIGAVVVLGILNFLTRRR